MTVISDKGLVGYIISTTNNTSKVQTIIDTATAVSATISTSRDSIIVRGTLDENYNLKATYIPTDAKLLQGDTVETSGIGGIYPKGIKIGKIKEIVKLVELEERINDKVSKYSLGMRQRLGIARALINEPNVLILDEPTNGLDPEGIKDLRNLLKKLAKEGLGILISSHNLAELESFCNKVLIIDNGTIIETSEVKEFKNNGNKYTFNVSNTKDLDIEGIYEVTKNKFSYNGEKEDIASIIKTLVKKNIDVYEVKMEELTLEEAFLKKTGGKKNDKVNKK